MDSSTPDTQPQPQPQEPETTPEADDSETKAEEESKQADEGITTATQQAQAVRNISMPNLMSEAQRHIEEAGEFLASFGEHYEKLKKFLDTRNDQSAIEQIRALKELIIDSPYVQLIPIPWFQDVLSTGSNWFIDTLDFLGIFDLEESQHKKFKSEVARTKIDEVLKTHHNFLKDNFDDYKKHRTDFQNTPYSTYDKYLTQLRIDPNKIKSVELNSRGGDSLETVYFKRKKRRDELE
jgi:hypothetical protein